MKDKYFNYFLMLVFILAVFLGLYRFFPYIFSDIPLGYDPGFYRKMFLDYFNSLPYIDFNSFTPLTKQSFPPFLGLFGNIVLLIGYDVDFLLTFGLAFFSFITSIYIYIYLKKYSKITAIHGMIIYFISIIQYESFFYNYYKQIIGVLFMIISLYLLDKKKYLLSIPIIISMFTVNRPAGVFFVMVVIVYFMLNISKNSILNPFAYLRERGYNKQDNCSSIDVKYLFYTVLFSGVISLLMYLPLFNELIWGLLKPLTTTFLGNGTSGTFFSLDEFIYYDFPVILLGFYGLYINIRKRDLDFTTIGYIVGLLWLLFRLFFYNRFLIFFDLFIILIAAYGLGELYQNKKKIYYSIFILFFCIQSYNYLEYLTLYAKPLITKSEFETINKLDTILEPEVMLMTTDKHYGPWLFGYTKMSIISPGFTNNNIWDKSDWDRWWDNDGKVKCEMIKDYEIYKKDLYIWYSKNNVDEDLSGGDCFEEFYEKDKIRILRVRF